ncbi:hypothetical protein ACVIWU_006787 [Bradyrhizobium sp. USDA 4509]
MIEAMTCGTPVIAYRAGSVPEVVDGITGFIVDNEGQAIRAVNEWIGSTEECSAPGARSASLRAGWRRGKNADIASCSIGTARRVGERGSHISPGGPNGFVELPDSHENYFFSHGDFVLLATGAIEAKCFLSQPKVQLARRLREATERLFEAGGPRFRRLASAARARQLPSGS